MITGKKIYMGCGEAVRAGFIGCDIRDLPTVEIVCPAWELSKHAAEVEEIYCRHMMEHLTLAEVDCTLRDWQKALAPGGKVHIVVPNIDHHIEQWQRAEWTEETFATGKSDARWGHAGFYGWQRQCNPNRSDYNQSYWDVHKTAFNEKVMRFLLNRVGFVGIEITISGVHLSAVATTGHQS